MLAIFMQALKDAITEQHEQEHSIESEIKAYRIDIVREQIRNEQLTAVETKLKEYLAFCTIRMTAWSSSKRSCR